MVSSSSPKSSSKKACCGKVGLKRGPWRPDEDELLINCIRREGEGRWRTLPKRAGLLRCGKSCRLRWMNYLRPSVKRGSITSDEEDLILRLHRLLGNRWSLIAGRIPGRTDNEIKNYWNTHISKKLISQGLDPRTHKPLNNINPNPYHHHHECLVSFPYADERHSSSNRLLLVSPELNPNPNCASASMSSHEILDTKSVDNSENQQHLIKRVTSTLDNQEQDLNNISDGGLIMGFPNMEEDGDRINNNTEDIFSSFLDSLINEEI